MNSISLVISLIFIFLSMFVFCLYLLSKNKTSSSKKIRNNSGIKLLFFLILFFLITLFTNMIFALIMFLIVGYFVYIYNQNKKIKYVNNINKQLLETIRLFRNIILSGQSIVQTIDTVSKQIKDPISSELKEIYNKVNLGISLDKALEDSSKNIKSQQYKLFLDSVRISNITGAKLSDILNKIEDSISKRISIYSTVQALTAQGKMSGIIVSIVPFFIIGFVYLFQPNMMSLLFTTIIGNIILLITVIMILLGSFLMNKIAQVDF